MLREHERKGSAMADMFTVGVTKDLSLYLGQMLEPILQQHLDQVPDLLTRHLLDTAGPVASAEELVDIDGLIHGSIRLSAESLAGEWRLTVIAQWGVGYDSIDVGACTANGIALCNTPDGVRRTVSEANLLLILALTKKLMPKVMLNRAGKWREGASAGGYCLKDHVVGTVGMGNIGSALVRLLKILEPARILCFDPYLNSSAATEPGVEQVNLDTLLRESDVVTINCPLTEETRHMISERELDLMRPTAYIINTARGPIIDELALIRALKENRIAGAGLDVTEKEPIDRGNPLLQMDNVIVTPHSLAVTEEHYRDCSAGACRVILAAARGEVPPWVVNKAVLDHPDFKAKLARFAR